MSPMKPAIRNNRKIIMLPLYNIEILVGVGNREGGGGIYYVTSASLKLRVYIYKRSLTYLVKVNDGGGGGWVVEYFVIIALFKTQGLNSSSSSSSSLLL